MPYRDFSKGYPIGPTQVSPGVWEGVLVAARVGPDGEMSRPLYEELHTRSPDQAITVWIYNQAEPPAKGQPAHKNECRYKGETLDLAGKSQDDMIAWLEARSSL